MLLDAMVKGSAAGVAATGAMSLSMLAGQRAGLVDKLAPERITEAVLDTVGVPRSESAENVATTANHFAYGAAGGALYAVVTRRAGGAGPLSGVLFGLALFAASYEGWVPAFRIMPPVHQAGARRTTQLAVAHVVYGAPLGALVARLSRRRG